MRNRVLPFLIAFYCVSASAVTVSHTLAMVADFDILTQNCTKAEIESLLFGPRSPHLSLADHFLDISDQQFTIDGDVIDGLVLNTTGQTGCFDTITDIANSLAQARGIDLSIYDHLLYFVPKPPGCAIDGWSTIGGTPPESVSFHCTNDAIFLHEFSHGQFSLRHSGKRNNPDPYADHSCPMGQGYYPYNAAWMYQLGYKVRSALGATGDYSLSPLDIPQAFATHPQFYVIATDLGDVFLSTRSDTTGHEAHQPENLLGVNIHFHESPLNDTIQEAVLSTGDFYCNQAYGFCVNQISKDATTTLFHVEMHAPSSNYWNGPSASRTPSITPSRSPTSTASTSTSFSATRTPSVSPTASRSTSASRSPDPSASSSGAPTQSPATSSTTQLESLTLLNVALLLLGAFFTS